MSGVKYRSKSNPKSAATTPGSTKKEPVVLVEGPRYSHYSWVARAVVITTVIVGVLYFIPKAQSRSKGISSHADTNDASHRMSYGRKNEPETGLVIRWNTLASGIPDIGLRNAARDCENAVQGNSRAETLKTWFTSLSKTKQLYIIEENPWPTWTKSQVGSNIRMCMQLLGWWDYFDGIYVWDSKDNDMQLWINNAIQLTGLDVSKLRFICRPGEMAEFLKKNNFNVIEDIFLSQDEDFQKLSSVSINN